MLASVVALETALSRAWMLVRVVIPAPPKETEAPARIHPRTCAHADKTLHARTHARTHTHTHPYTHAEHPRAMDRLLLHRLRGFGGCNVLEVEGVLQAAARTADSAEHP